MSVQTSFLGKLQNRFKSNGPGFYRRPSKKKKKQADRQVVITHRWDNVAWTRARETEIIADDIQDLYVGDLDAIAKGDEEARFGYENAPELVRDIWSLLYKPYGRLRPRNEVLKDAWFNREILKELQENPQFQLLQQKCSLDAVTTTMATDTMMDAVREILTRKGEARDDSNTRRNPGKYPPKPGQKPPKGGQKQPPQEGGEQGGEPQPGGEPGGEPTEGGQPGGEGGQQGDQPGSEQGQPGGDGGSEGQPQQGDQPGQSGGGEGEGGAQKGAGGKPGGDKDQDEGQDPEDEGQGDQEGDQDSEDDDNGCEGEGQGQGQGGDEADPDDWGSEGTGDDESDDDAEGDGEDEGDGAGDGSEGEESEGEGGGDGETGEDERQADLDKAWEEATAEAEEREDNQRLADLLGEDGDIERIMNKALNAAMDEIGELEKVRTGVGLEDGEWKTMDPAKRWEYAERFRTPEMRALSEIIGRMIRFALGCQATKINDVPHEIYDVTNGDDMLNALHSEYALMATPESEMVFFQRMIDKELLVYKKRGTEEAGKGPMVLAIDKSGSMNGAPFNWAMAVSEALRRICADQNRDYYAMFFGNNNDRNRFWFPKGKPQESWDEVFAFLSCVANGGTQFDGVLTEALERVQTQFDDETKGKADIVFITDGQAHLDPDWIKRFNEERERIGCKCYGVFVGGAYDYRGGTNSMMEFMRTFCDEVIPVAEFKPDSVREIFSRV